MNNSGFSVIITVNPGVLLVDLLIVALIAAPFVYLAYHPRSNAGKNKYLPESRVPVRWYSRRSHTRSKLLALRDNNRFRFYSDGPD